MFAISLFAWYIESESSFVGSRSFLYTTFNTPCYTLNSFEFLVWRIIDKSQTFAGFHFYILPCRLIRRNYVVRQNIKQYSPVRLLYSESRPWLCINIYSKHFSEYPDPVFENCLSRILLMRSRPFVECVNQCNCSLTRSAEKYAFGGIL